MVAWKISASSTEDKVFLVRFLDDPGPIEVPIPPALHGFDGSRTRLLVPASSHRQWVSSGDPT